jgi:hypothetical protein
MVGRWAGNALVCPPIPNSTFRELWLDSSGPRFLVVDRYFYRVARFVNLTRASEKNNCILLIISMLCIAFVVELNMGNMHQTPAKLQLIRLKSFDGRPLFYTVDRTARTCTCESFKSGGEHSCKHLEELV